MPPIASIRAAKSLLLAPFTEGWLICGRRAGKSFILAVVAVYLGCFRSYAEHLGPGERATIMVIATDRRQARVIFRYMRALITLTPLLKTMVERETADVIDLDNHVTIEIVTASYRTARGYTLAAVLCDEMAFWPTDDSAEPDYAVLDALQARHGDHSRRDAALRFLALRKTRGAYGMRFAGTSGPMIVTCSCGKRRPGR